MTSLGSRGAAGQGDLLLEEVPLLEIVTRLFDFFSSWSIVSKDGHGVRMYGEVLLGVLALPEVGASVVRVPSSLQTIERCELWELREDDLVAVRESTWVDMVVLVVMVDAAQVKHWTERHRLDLRVHASSWQSDV